MATAVALVVPDDRPSMALELPDGTTFGEWLSIGRRLKLGSQALNWHIGDWWKFGVSHWGEDETRKSALEIWGVEGETARNYGWVASKFSPVERSTDLSFSHYLKAASLPHDAAQRVILKAAHEGLSVRDVQREVQALKAVNDPEPAVEQQQPAHSPKSVSLPPEIRKAYEIAVELGEALQNTRPLKRRERYLLSLAYEALNHANTDLRKAPDDFEIIFVEKGRLACEEWYRASRITVNRWLVECGKSRLIDARAEFVKMGRVGSRHERPPAPAEHFDERDPLHRVAEEAADYLRISRYGGWRVSAHDDGSWLVGTVRKTSDELIAMAERQGFDSIAVCSALQPDSDDGVEG